MKLTQFISLGTTIVAIAVASCFATPSADAEEVFRLDENERFISHQSIANHHLSVLSRAQESELIFRLDGRALELSILDHQQPVLLTDQIIFTGVRFPSVITGIFSYQLGSGEVSALLGNPSDPVELLAAVESESGIRLAWTERTERSFLIKTCLVANNQCRGRELARYPLESTLLRLLVSKDTVMAKVVESESLHFDMCVLDQEGCQMRRYSPSAKQSELKNSVLMENDLVWSQQINGIFELRHLDLKARLWESQALTEKSSGDQINPDLAAIDTLGILVSWEDFGRSPQRLLARSIDQEDCQFSLEIAGRFPKISLPPGTERTESGCPTHILLSVLDSDGRRIDQHLVSREGGASAPATNSQVSSALFNRVEGGEVTLDLDLSQQVPQPPLARDEGSDLKKDALDDQAYQSLVSLQSEGPPSQLSEIQLRVTNIPPRSTVAELSIISGVAPDQNKPVWFYLVDDRKQSLELGRAAVSARGQFFFSSPTLPEDFNGELLLVASQIPDLKIASLFKTITDIVPFYLYGEEDLKAKRKVIELALEIENLSFHEGQTDLSTLKRDVLEVYRSNEKMPLTVNIRGRLYSDDLHGITLHSTSSLDPEQQSYSTNPEDPSIFEISLAMEQLQLNDSVQITIHANDLEKNQSTSQVISFVSKSSTGYPQFSGLILSSLRDNQTLHWIGALMILTAILGIGLAGTVPFVRILTSLILLVELGFAGHQGLMQAVLDLSYAGLITVPGQESTIQRSNPSLQAPLTLTRLDENGDPQPQLCKGWSNLSENVWEFALRGTDGFGNTLLSSQQVIDSVNDLIQSDSGQQQYLTSIQQMIAISPLKLQIITRSPDPLIPQKMSKVELRKAPALSEKMLAFSPLEVFPRYSRYKRNSSAPEFAFSGLLPLYQNEVITSNLENMTHLILQGTVDIFKNPAPELFGLFENHNYKLIPQINTESLILLANR
ncbi:MAG: hypothetical protein Q8P95_03270, partial [bacterium]|nr:hypothetical protein [bacterium]